MLIIAFLTVAQWAGAQKTYFVYLQSDNQQPFYVNIRGKNQSSTPMGYIILAKLHDSTYPIKIGFPGSGIQQEFDLTVEGNDLGFLVKNFGEKGYGLFNLQTFSLVMNTNDANRQKALALQQQVEEQKKADSIAAANAFTENQRVDSFQKAEAVLAQKQREDSIRLAAVQSSDTLKNTSQPAGTITAAVPAVSATGVVTAEKATPLSAKTDTSATVLAIEKNAAAGSDTLAQNIIQKDSLASLKAISNQVKTKDTLAPVAAEIMAKDTVQADLQNKTNVVAVAAIPKKEIAPAPKFLNMEIHDSAAALKPDTITIAPINSNSVIEPKHDSDATKIATEPIAAKAEVSEVKGSITLKKPVATITSNNANTIIVTAPAAVVPVVATPEATTEKPTATVSNNCKKIASEKDFFSLRKKLIGDNDPASKILEAKAVFRERCFTNDQIRSLCVLFLDDASRLRFLDEAYPYSTDPQAYKQLGNLFADEFYLRRFNTIIK
jgi:hypothetical protein